EVLGERIDGNYRYSWGDTKPTEGQKRYIWVCSDKKNANGDWEPDTTFANNGCIKLESNEVLRGLEVVPGPLGEPVLLTEGMDANGGKIVGGRLLERYQGTSQMRSDLDFQIDSSGNPRGSHLLCCSTDSGYPELVVEWKDDKGTHAQDLVEGSSQVQDENGFDINYVELSGDDLVLQSSSGDYPFAELLSGSGQTHSPSQAGDSPLSVGEASSLPPYETLVFVGRDDSTVDSNLVVARYQLGYPAGPCVADAHTVCIDDQPGDKRYRVTVHYATTQGGRDGQSHPGNAIALSSLGVTHGGLFWFFDAKNPEMLIKVLNGTNANQHRWVFYSAGTNVGLTTTVQDTETGAVVTYENPDRHPAAPVLDVSAFTSDGQVGSPYQQTDKSFDYAQDFVQAPEASTACATTDTSLCIDNRFEITVSYHTTQGGRDGSVQVGHAISLSSLSVDRGGLFWFFDKTNPEMLIKVLDACGLSGHYWVFYSAGTSVGLTARVVDTVNHLANTYTNDDKSQAPALLDQQAFPCN
ncbi:MAG TPA: hypothetical protein VKA53_01755, partial [Thermoanaerobaculia bacterium]|nr:hypothetical protein [Thermoanaerobaculia bacterium]